MHAKREEQTACLYGARGQSCEEPFRFMIVAAPLYFSEFVITWRWMSGSEGASDGIPDMSDKSFVRLVICVSVQRFSIAFFPGTVFINTGMS